MSTPRVPIVATTTPPDPIYIVRIYVDGAAVLYSPQSTINQFLWMPNGQQTVEVVAEDSATREALKKQDHSAASRRPSQSPKLRRSRFSQRHVLVLDLPTPP